jgi:hypothetical protein
MASSIHFPEDVFSLIKSFTKPKIVCSCCSYDGLCGEKYIVRSGDVICEDCDEKYCCSGCEICSMENDNCDVCGELACDDGDCSNQCMYCTNSFICTTCTKTITFGLYMCGECVENEVEP